MMVPRLIPRSATLSVVVVLTQIITYSIILANGLEIEMERIKGINLRASLFDVSSLMGVWMKCSWRSVWSIHRFIQSSDLLVVTSVLKWWDSVPILWSSSLAFTASGKSIKKTLTEGVWVLSRNLTSWQFVPVDPVTWERDGAYEAIFQQIVNNVKLNSSVMQSVVKWGFCSSGIRRSTWRYILSPAICGMCNSLKFPLRWTRSRTLCCSRGR